MLRRLRPVGDALYALGSDELGRDMLSRLIYGGRLSLAARIVESAVKDQFDHWLAGNPTQAAAAIIIVFAFVAPCGEPPSD